MRYIILFISVMEILFAGGQQSLVYPMACPMEYANEQQNRRFVTCKVTCESTLVRPQATTYFLPLDEKRR